MQRLENLEIKFTLSDGTVLGIPVKVIAKNRAKYYQHEFGDDLERSLQEDTVPLFLNDSYEAIDWVQNNMDLEDFLYRTRLVPGEKKSVTQMIKEAWNAAENLKITEK